MNWPDVTQSAYLEQDRLDGDFNDLGGNFSPMQVQTQRTPRESTHTMKMLQAPSNLMTEYMLKTHTETFAQPVLRQIMLLEQHYETDSTIMALAGQKAKIAQRYGMNEVTDEMMDRHMNLTVNVGMGATDPVMKLQKFVYAVSSYANIAKEPPPGIDLKSVWKEMAGLSGYQDGQRFLIDGVDPQVAKLTQTVQQMQKLIQQLQMQVKNKEGANIAKLEANKHSTDAKERIAHHNNITKLITAKMQTGDQDQSKILDHVMNIEMHGLEAEARKQELQHSQELHELEMGQEQEKLQHSQTENELDLQHQDQTNQMKMKHQQQSHAMKLKMAARNKSKPKPKRK